MPKSNFWKFGKSVRSNPGPDDDADFEGSVKTATADADADFQGSVRDAPQAPPSTAERLATAATSPVFDLSQPFGKTGEAIGTALGSIPAALGRRDIQAGIVTGLRGAGEDIGRLLSPSPLTYASAGLFNVGPAAQRLLSAGFALQSLGGAVHSYRQAIDETPRREGESNVQYSERLLMNPKMQGAQEQTAFSLLGLAGTLSKPIPRNTSAIEDGLTRGVKPAAKKYNWTADVQAAIPDLADQARAAQQAGKPITSVEGALDAVVNAKKAVWSEYESVLGPNVSKTVSTDSVANAIDGTVDKRFEEQNPRQAAEIHRIAGTYRNQNMTLGELENRLEGANRDLFSYYQKNKVSQRVAAADPAAAHTLAEAGAIRNVLNETLGQLTGADAASLKRRYGALSSLEGELLNRKNVNARLAPDSLAEQIAYARGVGKIALSLATGNVGGALEGAASMKMSSYLRERSSSDYLITQAFKELLKQGGPQRAYYRGPMPRPIRGLLPPGPLITPPPEEPSSVSSVRSGIPFLPELPLALPPAPVGQTEFVGGQPVTGPATESQSFTIPGLTAEEVAELNRRMQAKKNLSAGPSSFTGTQPPGASF